MCIRDSVGCICEYCFMPGSVGFVDGASVGGVNMGCSKDCVAQVLDTSSLFQSYGGDLPWSCADADLVFGNCEQSVREFGNTEERLKHKVLGTRQRGVRSSGQQPEGGSASRGNGEHGLRSIHTKGAALR